MTVKVVDKSANKFTVDGETAYAVPADGSGGGGALTAPLPHEPRNTEQQADNSRAAPCWNILFIFTKTPFPVLRHHCNSIAKVLASVRILSKCLRSKHYSRTVRRVPAPTGDLSGTDKIVAPRNNRRYDGYIPE